MSRWTMPASWAFCSPAATWERDLQRPEHVELAALDQRLTVLPWTSSIAMKSPSGPSSTS